MNPSDEEMIDLANRAAWGYVYDEPRKFKTAAGFPDKPNIREQMLLVNGIACSFPNDQAKQQLASHIENLPNDKKTRIVDAGLAKM